MKVIEELEKFLENEEKESKKYNSEINDQFSIDGNESYFQDFLDETFIKHNNDARQRKSIPSSLPDSTDSAVSSIEEIKISPRVRENVKKFEFAKNIQPSVKEIGNNWNGEDVPRWKRWNSEKSDSRTTFETQKPESRNRLASFPVKNRSKVNGN